MEKYWSILAIFMNIIDPMNYILEHPNFMSCIVINLDYLIIFLNSPVCSLSRISPESSCVAILHDCQVLGDRFVVLSHSFLLLVTLGSGLDPGGSIEHEQ